MNLRRLRNILFFALCGFCSSCASADSRIRQETRLTLVELVDALEEIECIDDLLAKREELQGLFYRLVDNAIAAKEWSMRFQRSFPLEEKDHILAQKLEYVFQACCEIEGAEYVLKELQASPLERLDTVAQKELW